MNRLSEIIFVVSIAFSQAACTADLVVMKADGKTEMAGIPIRQSESYILSGKHTKRKKGGPCSPNSFFQPIFLPTGDLYFINVESGPLASSEFSVALSDNGTLKSVSLNSENKAKDVLEGATTFIKDALPVLGVVDAVVSESLVAEGDEKESAVAADVAGLPACDTGPTDLKLKPIEALTAH